MVLVKLFCLGFSRPKKHYESSGSGNQHGHNIDHKEDHNDINAYCSERRLRFRTNSDTFYEAKHEVLQDDDSHFVDELDSVVHWALVGPSVHTITHVQNLNDDNGHEEPNFLPQEN